MPETVAAPAPAAASSPAPVSSPAPSAPAAAPAPVAAPATAPAAQPTRTFGAAAGVESHVDPNDSRFKPGSDDYLHALVQERLTVAEEKAKTLPAEPEQPLDVVTVEVPDPAATASEVPAPDAEVKPAEAEKPAVTEPEFELNPPKALTPEALTKMVTDSPEFGKLLESNPALKGQIYKTAREAAELKPYKEIFPDLEAAKEVVKEVSDFRDVRGIFLTSSTREGTEKALGKMAEMCYERDEDGNVLMQDGRPVIGDDFYGFVDNVVAIDLEHRGVTPAKLAEVKQRLQANQYHLDPNLKTQQEVEKAYYKDEARAELMGELLDAESPQNHDDSVPEHVKRKLDEISEREAKVQKLEYSSKVQTRQQFETSLQQEARTRGTNRIARIIASVKKQGAAIAPFLEDIIPNQIAKQMWDAIAADRGYTLAMENLQRLPVGDKSKSRRLAVIDRAIETYLPDIAAETLLKAGIQVAQNSATKKATEAAQAEATNQTEPRGSTAPSGNRPAGGMTMTSTAAFDHAQAEWQKANPNKPFDKTAKELILPRVLQLMTAGAR